MTAPGTDHVRAAIPPEAGDFLRVNDGFYREYVRIAARVAEVSGPAAALALAAQAATHAVVGHTGRFADGGIENVPFRAGLALRAPASAGAVAFRAQPLPAGKRRRVLHVTTFVADIGGHTRTITRWAQTDPWAQHSVLLTHQGDDPVPPSLVEAVIASGGRICVLAAGAGVMDKAAFVRAYADAHADLVIVNHAPHDVVSIVAFARAGGPPVVCINDNDHHFWLGPAIADLVVDLRTAVPGMSARRRFARGTVVLPIPIAVRQGLSRAESRRSLGLPDDQIVLVSIGRGNKYLPGRAHSFYSASRHILDAEPRAHVYLIGVREGEHAGRAGYLTHPRLHVLGPIPDPSSYQRAADVYLEGVPFGSQTACLESCLFAVPPVRSFAPYSPLLATHDVSIEGLVPIPGDEAAYVAEDTRLAADAAARESLGAEVSRRVIADHVGEGWLRHLEALYTRTDGLPHAPAELPEAPSLAEDDDLAVAALQLGQKLEGTWTQRQVDEAARAKLNLDAALSLGNASAYGAALAILHRSIGLAGWDRPRIVGLARIATHATRRAFGGGARSEPCTARTLP